MLNCRRTAKKQNNMKDFDLAAAKRGAKVCTREGKPARILCFNFKGIYASIVVAIETYPGREKIDCYTENGRYIDDAEFGPDLMMADDDYLEKLERGEYDHIEDNIEMVGKPDHIGESSEKVNWEYWRRMYAGLAMQGFCVESGVKMEANVIARWAVECVDALIEELKKEKK
jgi:hypothetical protein